MIIKKLELHRFGKFRETTVELADGMTARQLPNESGKTTLTDFICFIFYGFDKIRGKKTALCDNLLEKYLPWDSEEGISGAAEVQERGGKAWRIERRQDRSGKGSVRLFDGSGTEKFVPDVGEYLLGVDRETFLSVFFVGKSGQAFARTEQMEIAMKNLVTTGNEAVGYDSVMKYLAEEKANYAAPKRATGKLKRLSDDIRELEDELLQAEVECKSLESGIPSSAETEKSVAQCDRELRELAEQRQKHRASEAYTRRQKRAELKAQQERLLREIDEHRVFLPPEKAATLEKGFWETERAELLLKEAEKSLLAIQQQAPELTERHRAVLAYEGAAGGRGGLWAGAVAAAVVATAAAVGAVLWQSLLWIGAVICLAAAVLLGILAGRLPRALGELNIRTRAGLHKELLAAKAVREAQWQHQREQAAAAKTVSDHKQNLQALRRKYAPLLRQSGIENRQQLEQVRQNNARAEEMSRRAEDLKERLAELEPFAQEDERIADAEPPIISLSQISEEESFWRHKKEEALRRQAHSAADAAAAEHLREKIVAINEQLEGLREKQAAMQRAYRVVCIAMEHMEAAQSALRDNYAPLLRGAMEQKLAHLTDGRYDTVLLDEELAVRIKAEGSMRELGYFSDGTRDAALMALRLSLAEILEGEKKLPMIFDDPFLHFDGARFSLMRKYLEKAAAKRQILLLSCRELA